MLLHAAPSGQSETAPFCRPGFYELPPSFSQRMGISERHYRASLSNNQGGIPHVCHDTGCSACHGFTDYDRKSFTEGGSRGYVQSGKESRHILTHAQEMTTVTYACCLDPIHQLRVFPCNLKPAKQEVNLGHLFVESRGGANEVEMILQGMEASRY
jgi:hypothetical protein